MHRRKATTAKRIIAWGMGAALYLAVLVFAGNLAAGTQTTSGATAAMEPSTVTAQQAAEAGADAATALVTDTIDAANVGESPLVTLAIAAAGLSLAGVTWLIGLARRRMAGHQRARHARTSVRRVSIPT